ncbi:MAG: hypothetical protein GY940_06095, partial [bacterium]|nr:hypothetical protein [bacterium]
MGCVRPFDLSKAPLLRVGVVELDSKKHILMFDMHHIISDGVSIGLFSKEFMALYNGVELPGLPTRYKDYVQWQGKNREEESEILEEQEKFWLKEFSGEIPVLNLPADFPRPPVRSFTGSLKDFKLDKSQTSGLEAIAARHDCTLFMLLFSLFNVFLSRLSGQEEIVVGTPLAGRRHTGIEPLIGMFVNTLALRNTPTAKKTFTGFLEEVRQRTLEAFVNQDYQFEELVEKVAVQ